MRVENHDARRDEDHVDFGVTATRGTPVRIDRLFAEADLKIATGLVEPHFMAGWSGGRKVVAPGVAHHETIRTFHPARFMGIRWRSSAISWAIPCTRSNSRSSRCWAMSTPAIRGSTRSATSSA
ncbi:lactate racemase domain-containing protein [Aureimonas sp. N4]|uniref:lactate racemase domain-containing protein n=1 Tax=Aureimonas sp. N4 TaxID=1638165 RepID=UPI00244E5CD0|nr:lactate racemase domain-containing protein [Aureimonas sp. N4]